MMLNINAHQNPSTIKPGTIELAIRIINAFITNKNNPNVTIVTGIVSTTKKGFRILFNKANTAATIIADRKLSIWTPGNKYDVTIIAIPLISILNNIFITHY